MLGTARPAVEEPASQGAAEAALRQGYPGVRLLVAEDGLINQEVAGALLEYVGLAVDIAEDSVVAAQKAIDGGYAAILMDMQVPRMDGLDAARELRSRGVGIPIIAMTANAFTEDREACLAAGMNDHRGKPVNAESLYGTLLRWLPQPAPPAGHQAPA